MLRSLILLGATLAVVAPCGRGWAQGRDPFQQVRNRMVDEAVVGAGVKDPRVIAAVRNVPRHEFVPLAQRQYAYYDMALPIGSSQTISPPFIVAYMTEQLEPQPTDKVLEIGTGSGYQAAVLSGLVREVYTIEIVESLGRRAAAALRRLRYDNAYVKIGDGYQGWPEKAPFDKIIVTCSPERVPPALVEQLREGGRMVIPIGKRYQQNLCLMKKVGGKMEIESLHPTLFVPMTGEAEQRREKRPDPAHPAVYNGDFEELIQDAGQTSGWHYQRQMEIVSQGGSPSGGNCLLFSNSQPGRPAQVLQGLAVDGREVRQLKIRLEVRGQDLRSGQDLEQQPMLDVLFYDDRRGIAGEGTVGPWRGSFDWRSQSAVIAVPPRAREAILRIGLLGGTGKLWVDRIQLERYDPKR
jgi:protein-L-isoaspartate(D-aspartate) O-methyltransferase